MTKMKYHAAALIAVIEKGLLVIDNVNSMNSLLSLNDIVSFILWSKKDIICVNLMNSLLFFQRHR